MAGTIPSALAWLASCVGMYRLMRRWLRPAPAAIALAFFALNPNLIYMQTTAMTEPLFVCEMVWTVAWLVEWRAGLDEGDERRTNRLTWLIALALVAAVFTRYDGWIMALAAWTAMGSHAAAARKAAFARLLDGERGGGGGAAGVVRLQRRGVRRLALFCARTVFGQGD